MATGIKENGGRGGWGGFSFGSGGGGTGGGAQKRCNGLVGKVQQTLRGDKNHTVEPVS